MALQHLRASVANKRPAPSGMSDGQLAINTNDASPGLFFKNASGALVKIGPVHVGTTAPNATPASGGTSGNTTGELWLDSTGGDYALKTWDGSAWRTTVVTSGMIKDGTIGNADINDSAAIALSKLATGALPTGITIASGNIVDGTITDADVNASAGIAYSKLALSSGIVNADISGSAAIALSKIASGALPTSITVASANLVDGTIVNDDINASAAIADTKLSTISTAGKVSGTAITSGQISTSGNLTITNTTPSVRLVDSDGTSTQSETLLVKDSNIFQIQTRTSADVYVSNDYNITSDSSGASLHEWLIANIEKARLDSDGLKIVNDVRVGNSAGVNITSSSSNGHQFLNNGVVFHASAGAAPLYVGRNTDDGNLVAFYQDGTAEGTISVAGSTVSYNPFLGSHWGRLADGGKPDILPGTILDTVDRLIEWKQAKFTVDGEEKIAAYNGPAEVGDTVAIDYEGISYSAIVQNEEEEPEELNKHVCVKVNDTASSKAVFGVFLGWDNDIPGNMISTWNDLYCAAVGNYFVRIADGETLEIGSLIEADGNGCGIVQDDDIIRSKTVAKITSTIPQKVYDDGSFLVTCVLCCG